MRLVIPELDKERREQRALLRKFKGALLAGDVDAVADLCGKIDADCIWPLAWRGVINIKQDLSDDVKNFFVKVWFKYGAKLRQESNDDLLLIKALRKVMPPYRGGDMTLYRGESASNRDKRTYGVCWSAQKYIARQHAEGNIGGHPYGEGGSRPLQAKVPASAIITHIGADTVEDEYLVDRRGLPGNAVRVVETFQQQFPPWKDQHQHQRLGRKRRT